MPFDPKTKGNIRNLPEFAFPWIKWCKGFPKGICESGRDFLKIT